MTEGDDSRGPRRTPPQSAREALIEMVAEADESLMEKFFEAGTLTQEELTKGLAAATRAAKIVPAGVHVGPAEHRRAAVAWTRCSRICPRPPIARSRRWPTRNRSRKTADEKAPYAAFVWKTVADQFAGRITMFRVYQGCLKADSTVTNATQGTPERLGHLIAMQGKTATNVPELKAGDLGAVAKLKDTRTNDTLADKAAGITFAPIAFPEPVLSYAIEPKSRGDEDKISTAMHRLEEEDSTIKYQRDPQTHELLLAGQGQMHIEVTVAKLKRRFGVEVLLKPPRIPYRETITSRVEAHGRHKKQTGGHGQFGDCKIKMEPLPRGSEFEFVDEIFGGSIPRGFIPAVEKGIQESRLRGYLAGYPVVDFRVTLYDGSYHDVDSNELSFKTAGWLAFKDGMSRAKPTLLEPIMNVDDPRAERQRRRPDGRPQRPARPHFRHGSARQDDRDQGAGADVGDADLRAAPDVGDRRPRLVSHGVLALRRGAEPPADRRSSPPRRPSAARWRRNRLKQLPYGDRLSQGLAGPMPESPIPSRSGR